MSDGTPEEEPECSTCEGTGVYDELEGKYDFVESYTACDHGEDTEVTRGS